MATVFNNMAGGRWWGALFFLFMVFAAMSTVLAVCENILAMVRELTGWNRRKGCLVCGIGITNAMMMAVTERFNEIATLKCLGALDGFIMIMFVLESCFMGLVGGLIGSVLGGIIGLSRMLVSFGSAFFSAIPLGDLMLGMVISILLGTLLAAISAVIPSYKAARLAPMEAMRVE